MSELFAPADVQWTGISKRLATLRRILGVPPFLGIAVIFAFLPLIPDQPAAVVVIWILGAVVFLGFAIFIWIWAGREVRRWGYAERADDLLVTHGILFRRTVAVPYGRMQFVDVQAGPLARAFGLASVTLHTASSATAATIPGLPHAEARRLRNRLTELGEAHGAGL